MKVCLMAPGKGQGSPSTSQGVAPQGISMLGALRHFKIIVISKFHRVMRVYDIEIYNL